uniref:Putative lipocalin-3 1 n=1 Tax=Amblyomma cajennense TaxID=34607 RepID=A0A023FG94_AMBCJ
MEKPNIQVVAIAFLIVGLCSSASQGTQERIDSGELDIYKFLSGADGILTLSSSKEGLRCRYDAIGIVTTINVTLTRYLLERSNREHLLRQNRPQRLELTGRFNKWNSNFDVQEKYDTVVLTNKGGGYTSTETIIYHKNKCAVFSVSGSRNAIGSRTPKTILEVRWKYSGGSESDQLLCLQDAKNFLRQQPSTQPKLLGDQSCLPKTATPESA